MSDTGNHDLAVDQERRGPDAEGGINDGREAVGPVMAVAREAADARTIPAHHQPIAVMFDFVNPQRAGRRSSRLRRLARLDEAGGTPRGRSCCRRAILFVGPAHDDPERIVRQWPLQRLGLVPRCAHPNVPLFIGGQDHGLTGNIPIL